MEQIRAWWADAQVWLAAASPRERRMILLAAGAVLLFIVLIGYASFSSAIGRAEDALEEKRTDSRRSRGWPRDMGRRSRSGNFWRRGSGRALPR